MLPLHLDFGMASQLEKEGAVVDQRAQEEPQQEQRLEEQQQVEETEEPHPEQETVTATINEKTNDRELRESEAPVPAPEPAPEPEPELSTPFQTPTPSLQDELRTQLIQSGERDRLVGLLKDRLVECGWKDELKKHCREVMKERARKGNDTRNIEGVTREVITHAQKTVPDSVKAEFLAKVRQFMLKKN